MKQRGIAPGQRILEIGYVAPPEQVRQHLELPDDSFETRVNVEGTRNLVEACREAGTQRRLARGKASRTRLKRSGPEKSK